MSRFFLTNDDILESGRIILTGENFHHFSKVLRGTKGERVEVCDGKGTDYICKAESFDKERVELIIEETRCSEAENGPFITLYQCTPKSDKMEQIITRCIEMGVSRIVPVISQNCVSRPEGDKKTARWQKIALAAAKQSGRGILPEVSPIITFKQAIEEMAKCELAFVCYEKEKKQDLSTVSAGAKEIAFLIGPEGGLSETECAAWEKQGIRAVSLGERILRTENAAAYVLPILFYKSQTEV